MKRASEAADLIRKHAENGGLIHVVSHSDADGLAAAGVIGKALARLDATFRIRIEQWIDEKVVDAISEDKPSLIIFTDFGSGDIDLLNSRLKDHQLIILDHHQQVREANPSFIHVNPHLYGIDGSRDLSGAGTTYITAKAIDEANVDLACIAVVGALGDIQDKYEQRSFGGLNKLIVKDSVNAGYLTIETDLLFFGRETRPIHKALAYTTTPFIAGLSGEEDKSLAFLASLGITPKRDDKWRALCDLSEDEKKKLFNALTDYLLSQGFTPDITLSLRGNVYTFVHEEPGTPLKDAREFSVLLNAVGRMGRPSIGVAMCMGDRGSALEEGNAVLDDYRRTIAKFLNWIMEPGRIEELSSIYVARGESVINERIIGTISSILSTSLPKREKPIIAYSLVSEEKLAKISARAIDRLIDKGLNLGEILRIAAEKYEGKGGGHNIAAGAQVPLDYLEPFLKLVNELVKKQLEAPTVGS